MKMSESITVSRKDLREMMEELDHLREHVISLQERGTKLTLENREMRRVLRIIAEAGERGNSTMALEVLGRFPK
jgi:regulator of replication initiation timing